MIKILHVIADLRSERFLKVSQCLVVGGFLSVAYSYNYPSCQNIRTYRFFCCYRVECGLCSGLFGLLYILNLCLFSFSR